MKLLGRADLGPTRSDLEKLLEDGRRSRPEAYLCSQSGARHGWHDFKDAPVVSLTSRDL